MIRGGRCGTFRHGGRDVRLTDVSGEVINEILT
jgi:DNA gyrase inhibitor GyrI